MKVMIDIPDDHKRVIDNLVKDGKGYLLPYEVENQMAIAIRNGKVLSDMTNGDVIKLMFPSDAKELDMSKSHLMYYGLDYIKEFRKEWWNAPYKKEVEE